MRLHRKPPQLKNFQDNGPSRRRELVRVTAKEENHWTKRKHHSRKDERKPESNVLLCPDHRYRADQRTDVDHQVEVEEDAVDRLGRINDVPLASIRIGLYVRPDIFVLFGNQWGDVGSMPLA